MNNMTGSQARAIKTKTKQMYTKWKGRNKMPSCTEDSTVYAKEITKNLQKILGINK